MMETPEQWVNNVVLVKQFDEQRQLFDCVLLTNCPEKIT